MARKSKLSASQWQEVVLMLLLRREEPAATLGMPNTTQVSGL